MRRTTKRKILFAGLTTVFVIVMAAILLKAVDIYIDRTTTYKLGLVYDGYMEKDTMRSFDLYPYTGFHIQENLRESGPQIWNSVYKDYDYHSGQHGFFNDFDIDAPPPKPPNELRIILTGGSSAQGWGGRTNDDMFYKRLEKRLNADLAAQGKTVRMINLAMGASTSYQNFITLNRWGHDWSPDLIISFSGRNDWVVPVFEQNGAILPSLFQNAMGLVDFTKHSHSPDWFKAFARLYPNIATQTPLGLLVRSFYLGSYIGEDKQRYYREMPHGQDAADKEYVHALKSISRDFPGVPMLVAFQPWHPNHVPPAWAAGWHNLTDYAKQALSHEPPGTWTLTDVNESFLARGFYTNTSFVDDCHLSNEGHQMVTDLLTPVIEKIFADRGLARLPPS